MQRDDVRHEPPQIALIGGSGRTGSALSRLLAGADRRFRVLTRDPERTGRMLGSHAEPVAANVWDPFSVEAALTGVERVFLHGVDPSLEPQVIAAARRAGVKRIVMGSAVGAHGGAAPEHQDAEDALRESGISWTLLRPTAYMQSLAELVEWTMRGDAMRLPLGDAAVSWVDCRDVAAVAMHAILESAHEGCTYVISGPRALTGSDVAETLAHALGRPLRYAPMAADRADAELRALGLSADRARAVAARCAVLRSGAMSIVTDVVARIAHIEPRTLAHFAARHSWAMERPGAHA